MLYISIDDKTISSTLYYKVLLTLLLFNNYSTKFLYNFSRVVEPLIHIYVLIGC